MRLLRSRAEEVQHLPKAPGGLQSVVLRQGHTQQLGLAATEGEIR